jgi:hypothetical protein
MSDYQRIKNSIKESVEADFNQAIQDGRVVGAEPIPVNGNVVNAQGEVSSEAAVDDAAQNSPAPAGDEGVSDTTETTSDVPSTPTVPPGMESLIAENGKIMGKYNSWEDLANGFMHLNQTLTSTLDENTALKGRIAGQGEFVPPAAMAPVGSAGAPQGDDPLPSAEDLAKDPAVARFAEETGADPASVGKLAGIIYDRTMQTVMPQLQQQANQSQAQRAEAEAEMYMRQHHPEAYNHATEIQNFVRATPELADMVQRALNNGDRKYAMELAWREYRTAANIHQEKVTRAKAEDADVERKQARADASSPSTPSAPIASKDLKKPAGVSREKLQDLIRREKAGDREAAAERRYETYGKSLPDWMFPNREPRGN